MSSIFLLFLKSLISTYKLLQQKKPTSSTIWPNLRTKKKRTPSRHKTKNPLIPMVCWQQPPTEPSRAFSCIRLRTRSSRRPSPEKKWNNWDRRTTTWRFYRGTLTPYNNLGYHLEMIPGGWPLEWYPKHPCFGGLTPIYRHFKDHFKGFLETSRGTFPISLNNLWIIPARQFGCFLKWWVFPPISNPKLLIIFRRSFPMGLLGKPTILGNTHMSNGHKTRKGHTMSHPDWFIFLDLFGFWKKIP